MLYVIIGRRFADTVIEELSTRCTLPDILRYLEDEYRLAKQYPNCKAGLYYEYTNIKVINKQ